MPYRSIQPFHPSRKSEFNHICIIFPLPRQRNFSPRKRTRQVPLTSRTQSQLKPLTTRERERNVRGGDSKRRVSTPSSLHPNLIFSIHSNPSHPLHGDSHPPPPHHPHFLELLVKRPRISYVSFVLDRSHQFLREGREVEMSIQFDNLRFFSWLRKRGMMRSKVRNLVVDYLSLLRVGKKIRRRRKRLMRGERGRLLVQEVKGQRWMV